MPAEKPTDQPAPPSQAIQRLWLAVYIIIFAFAAVLAAETVLRIRFPWDLYFWSESPFLTDTLKLDHHQPVYSHPADANSFIYSPGLEYLCYAVLKPFGLELDIRFCRLVVVILGLCASVFGALAIMRLAGPVIRPGRKPLYFLATCCLVWLVLSKNYMADNMHPDNFHAFHATGVFFLCLIAIETRRFSAALFTILFAGLGVFTKQTEALAFAGPVLAFAIFNPWGWKRWLILAAVGAVTLAVSLCVLWSSPYAKFWTFDLLLHERILPGRTINMVADFIHRSRGLILLLAIAAAVFLRKSRDNGARRYLICWSSVAVFTVLPNLAAYLKDMGAWNDLNIFEIWFIMIIWPAFALMAASLAATQPAPVEPPSHSSKSPCWSVAFCALTVLMLLLLVPQKVPPRPGDFDFATRIEDSVRSDVRAGRKVLVTASTEMLIRCGVNQVPLDRCVTVFELTAGKLDSLSATKSRIDARYYDRIYLLMSNWYSDDINDAINRNYFVTNTISKNTSYSQVIPWNCPVLSPKPTN